MHTDADKGAARLYDLGPRAAKTANPPLRAPHK